MTQAALEVVVRALDPDATGRVGAVEFSFEGVDMACVSDATHGRMRLIAPVREARGLTGEQIAGVLSANFSSALDGRYGISKGVLYAAFMHPLGPLTDEEIQSAVQQLASLVRTFGTTYSSGILVYRDPSQVL